MKKSIIIYFFLLLMTVDNSYAQKALSTGDKMPGFYLKDTVGKEFYSKNYFNDNPQKKAIIFCVCASYCKPCKKEITFLENIFTKYKDLGLDVYLIAEEKEIDAVKIAELTGTKLPILVDKYNLLFKLMGHSGIPKTFLVDKNSEIMYMINGFSENKADEIIKGLENEIINVIGSGNLPDNK